MALLEALQTYLPQRVSSNVDWALNAAGGLAGAMTTFTAYVTTAALLNSRRPNRKDAR